MLVIGQMQLHEDSMQACEARVRYDVKQESWTLEGFFPSRCIGSDAICTR